MDNRNEVIDLCCLSLFFLVMSLPYCKAQSEVNPAERGRRLFQAHCTPCHDVHREMVGPMLASIPRKRNEEWLIRFILNSQQVVASGDEYASHLYQQYNYQVMPSFKNEFSTNDIREILRYIESESIHPTEAVEDVNEDVMQSNVVNLTRGKQIFDQQCSSCHAIQQENFGPALGSVTKRLPRNWLIAFIKNSQQVIKAGDEYGVQLFNSYDQKVMVPMEFLDEHAINSVLDYIEFASSSDHAEAGVNGRKKDYDAVHPIRAALIQVPKKWKSSFKILFIVLSLCGAAIHVFLITKLFRYLQQGQK